MSAVLPAILSAIAATIAAVFAGISLYVSGRREHLRWLRDSLVVSYEECLTASFDAPGRRAFEARLRGDADALGEYRQQAAAAHGRQTATLTRLRMIAPADVVVAAEELHEADHAVVDVALETSSAVDEGAFAQLRSKQWEARSAFVAQVRRSLGLSQGAPIGHQA